MLNSLEHFTVNQLSVLRGGRVELRTSRFRLSLPFQSETNQCCFLGRKLALNERNPSSSIWPIKSKVFRPLIFLAPRSLRLRWTGGSVHEDD